MKLPDTFPKVQGRCPACGCGSLFLGSGGYVTCAILSCPNPSAATDLLASDPPLQVRKPRTGNVGLPSVDSLT